MAAIIKPGTDVSRRNFLKGTATLSFAVAVNGSGAGMLLSANEAMAQAGGSAISVWLTIHPDNTITMFTPGAEMGQGSMTSVPLMLAEEMDADWDKVRLEWAPSDVQVYGYGSGDRKSMAIVGSRAVRSYFDVMRTAGAQVRKVLLGAAASHWNVPVAELTTEPSMVVHALSNRRLSYGEIAQFAQVTVMPEVGEADFKKPGQYRLVGKTQPRRDIPLKVNGTAQFAIDVSLPGMQYASTLHSPMQGAAPDSWNDAEIKAMKGISAVVKLPTGVAIVGDSFANVMAARKQLKVNWGATKSRGYDSETVLEQDYVKVHADPAAESKPVFSKGDANVAFNGAARTYKADFRADYAYHAQMEPLNAVARVSTGGDQVEVWDGSQSPDRCRQLVAEALGISQSQVTINQCYMGGGFGRRSEGDYAVEAALVAREVKKPVKLIWTREEDIGYGMFRPQNYQCLEAALDATGKVTGWKHCIVGDGEGLLTGGMQIDLYYKVPNQYIDLRGTSHGIRLKHWRAVAHPFNIFAIEEFIDQMAIAEGVDPITFRLERMAITPRGQKLFEKVAAMSDWNTPRPEGRALGLSITERSGSLGACVVEASLNKTLGKIKVHKVWMAVDGGLIVQPDAARANIESGINYGLSSVLHERITLKGGVVQQTNFHEYNVMRMSDTPEEIHIEFIDPDQKRPQGLGEIGNPAIPAAVAGAFFRLTGKRLSHMPFTRERVLAALQA
jgi:isoquinoline 1-oxidoreductase subunit beta